jgi:hypothetical protein
MDRRHRAGRCSHGGVWLKLYLGSNRLGSLFQRGNGYEVHVHGELDDAEVLHSCMYLTVNKHDNMHLSL